ncbi:SHORT-CHAIN DEHYDROGENASES/REDUCTASE FAMILY MEMBER protein, putative [Babesia bigemina]|uniref:SHORT-CHAIN DEHYDROGENASES/REDUCTASE FAMILY MEMBER protein, putative n=1 Tax=Babesia bigemina TaxID=5866 RepID=A0A061D0Y7_BABBI|nr:SHORT-CHAIN DEHYDROGENASES/REDUCTASE FAMILY MEMBER protein, putative [Babesia bigemina]CDR94476.1 SHORT-CHAIN DEHYDROGENASES/REDUCTASE FAMILY MEMBER protein, putative [Babesia bigemina]|eukprot:XP_012766662.1 SHORT-CHAIN DEHYDROGENASES/REDUCTASE FAMILY MEMBER protein, putative [Babesia bigemina]
MHKGSVIITGCDSGLGLALCSLLPRHGYYVLATCLTEEGAEVATAAINGDLDAAHCQLKVQNGCIECKEGTCFLLDVTSASAVESFCDDVTRRVTATRIPPLYAIVNNAGIWRFGLLQDAFKSPENRLAEVDRWKEVLDTNLLGALRVTLAFANQLHQSTDGCDPRVVFISSVLDRHALPGQGAYVASKFAISGFHETLCHELAGTNIRPVIIRPGALKNTRLFNRDLDRQNAAQTQRLEHDADLLKASYRVLLHFAGDCNQVALTVLDALQTKEPDSEISNVTGALPFMVAEYLPRRLFVQIVRVVLRNLGWLYHRAASIFRRRLRD